MIFARKVWQLLVGIKDAMALTFLLGFFFLIYAVLLSRPSPGQVREGALLLKLDGAIVEEPAAVDPFSTLISGSMPSHQYRVRDLVRALDAAITDDKIKAVVLDLSKFSGGGLVHMEEVGEALDRVKAAKKPVLTFAYGYADDALLLAAHSSEVWVDPLGGAFILGPGGQGLYYAKLLERFKVNTHVYRVGTYKEFVEPYTRNDMSEPAREARTAVVGALFDEWKANLAKARPQANIKLVTEDPAGWYQAAGGDGAQAAKTAGLVDQIGDNVAFGKRVAKLTGEDLLDPHPGGFAHSTLKAFLAAHEPKKPGKAIGVITIAGDIVDGKAGPGTAGGERIANLLDGKDARDIAALVIRVDSPGGSVTASERIRTAIERHKARGIPVVVSMANVAASGGYWVATPGTRIFAEPGTVTGSIGIFAVVTSFEKTLADYGVTADGVRSTPLSGQPDILGGFTPELDAMLQATIERGYQRFVGLVGQSRGKTITQVDAMAQGRIWDGGTARQLGLVDQFGSLDDAVVYAAAQAKLEKDDYHPRYLGENQSVYASLLEQLTGDDGSSESQGGDLFAQLSGRQQAMMARAFSDAERMLASRGMQAYCLECSVTAPPLTRPSGTSGLLGWMRALMVR